MQIVCSKVISVHNKCNYIYSTFSCTYARYLESLYQTLCAGRLCRLWLVIERVYERLDSRTTLRATLVLLRGDLWCLFVGGVAGGVAGRVTRGVTRGVAGGVTRGVAGGVTRGVTRGVARGVAGGVTRGLAGGVTGGVTGVSKSEGPSFYF